MLRIFLAAAMLAMALNLQAQTTDSVVIRKIFNEALSKGKSYEMLDYLSNRIGGRLSGSPEAAAAVEFTRQVMDTMGFDRVFLQEVMVPHWVRGDKEVAKVINSKKMGTRDMRICALGNSVGTGPDGLTAKVIEVKSLAEVAKLGKEKVQGKIIFYNRPMDPTMVKTFDAYGEAGDQRRAGPSEAAKFGAVGVIVRSLTNRLDDYPHTGSLRYDTTVKKIPAVAISTNDAEVLSWLLKSDADLQFYFRTTSQMLPDVLSYNVIGEIKGAEKPDEIIVVAGHLDSWDTGDGSHDDGAGCVQAIEVLRLYKKLGIRPKRTVRAVMYMNEENGLRGGIKYAELALKNKEKHVAAIESDEGGFTPRGFSIEADDRVVKKVKAWRPLLEPYGLHDIEKGGSGADIGPLKPQNVALFSFVPDSQRYFDYHHTEIDTFDKINRRELELGGASMAALAYLIAEYGL